MSRRAALQFLGLGAGVVAVAGAGWADLARDHRWSLLHRNRPGLYGWAKRIPAGHPLNLVRAAILAANAHNTQPWLFTVADDRIELFADLSRTIGTMDPLLRELHISLGCALENLTLAGPPNGIAATVALLPDPADPTHIATISLTPTQRSRRFAVVRRHHRTGTPTAAPTTPPAR